MLAVGIIRHQTHDRLAGRDDLRVFKVHGTRYMQLAVGVSLAQVDNQEIICLGAYEGESLVGSIFFTRLRFNQAIRVYMLAPVAVSTDHQGKGVGQALINFGLADLKDRAVDVAITYGDPGFYSRVGFVPLSENVIKAPVKLSMPAGWLGQSLGDEPIPAMSDRPRCVREFNDPVYW